MDLKYFEIIQSIIKAGGKKYDGRWEVRNKEGFLHNTNGPARLSDNGDVYWLLNGLFHRIGGPAVIYSDGTEGWYIDGEPVKPPAADPRIATIQPRT